MGDLRLTRGDALNQRVSSDFIEWPEGKPIAAFFAARKIILEISRIGKRKEYTRLGDLMGKTSTRKIGLEVSTQLYDRLSKVAERNGQSRRFLLERALEHYLEVVVPSQTTIRPEVMKHFRRSTEKNKKLHKLLAQ